MQFKSNAFMILKDFITLVENQHSCSVNIVRTDNDREFINEDRKQFFVKKEIVHRTTCRYTSQQNVVLQKENTDTCLKCHDP